MGDCNDSDPDVGPERSEACSDDIDNNCNGTVNENCADSGGTPTANIVSGILLAAWLGISAWRRRRRYQR